MVFEMIGPKPVWGRFANLVCMELESMFNFCVRNISGFLTGISVQVRNGKNMCD